MTACAICATTGHLILTRQGLRCGACLRGEAEEARTWMEAYKAIVVDLAACNPVQGIYNGGDTIETCALCGATGGFEDEVYLTKLRIEHKPTCLKRRAVEATKP